MINGISINMYLLLCTVIFIIGAIGVMARRNTIILFMCIELMLNAVNLLLVAFSTLHNDASGQVFVFFSLESCGWEDSNLHGGYPPDPKSGASANSATRASLIQNRLRIRGWGSVLALYPVDPKNGPPQSQTSSLKLRARTLISSKAGRWRLSPKVPNLLQYESNGQ